MPLKFWRQGNNLAGLLLCCHNEFILSNEAFGEQALFDQPGALRKTDFIRNLSGLMSLKCQIDDKVDHFFVIVQRFVFQY